MEWKESRTESTPNSHSHKQDITAECWGSSTELSVGNTAAIATFQPNSIPYNALLGSTQNNCRDKGQKNRAAQQLQTKHQDYLEGNWATPLFHTPKLSKISLDEAVQEYKH